jgi:RNA polymerase sigma-70 factor (ECF subfamily)
MDDAARESCERGWHAAALRGDAEAWRALYDSAYESVATYARWRGGALAEEIVQDAWLAAARRLASFDPARARFAAWVGGIAANVATAHVRKALKHRTASLAAVPEPAGAEPADGERVAVALATLPEHYEAVLRAKYFDRLSVAAIATQRRESEKATESLLARARQAFREAYGEPP